MNCPQFLTLVGGFTNIHACQYKQKHRCQICNIIKKRGTIVTYHNLVKELEYRHENNAAMTNIVKAPRGRIEHSSTVKSGPGINFQSDKHT